VRRLIVAHTKRRSGNRAFDPIPSQKARALESAPWRQTQRSLLQPSDHCVVSWGSSLGASSSSWGTRLSLSRSDIDSRGCGAPSAVLLAH
jgi:hypothetical protein